MDDERDVDLEALVQRLEEEAAERREAERALRASEKEKEAYLNYAADAILMSRLDGTLFWVNHTAVKMFGYSRQELEGRPFEVLLPDGEYSHYREVFAAIKSRGEGGVRDGWIRCKDGVVVPVDVSGRVITVRGQKVVQGIFRDVSDRWRAECRLEQRLRMEKLVASLSSRFLRATLEQVDHEIREGVREAGEFVGVDRAYLFLFSADRERFSKTYEWCAPGVESFIDRLQGLRRSAYGPIVEHLEGGRVWHVPRVVDLPGEPGYAREELIGRGVHTVVLVPLLSREGMVGFAGYDSVGTEREWAQEELLLLELVAEVFAVGVVRRDVERRLRDSKERFRVLFENAPVAYLSVNAGDGSIADCNRKARALFALGGRELATMRVQELLADPPGSAAAADLTPLFGGRQVVADLEVEMERKGGERFWAAVSVEPIRVPLGRTDQLLMAVVDVTDRKRIEGQERYYSFQAGVAEMATTLLHNIGNAIMSISHRSSQLLKRGEELDEIGRIFEEIRDHAEERVARGETPEEVLARLLPVLREAGREIRRVVGEELRPFSAQIGTGVEHIAEIIKIHQESANPRGLVSRFDFRHMLEDAVAIQGDVLEKYRVAAAVNCEVGEVTLPRGQILQLVINLIKNAREAVVQTGRFDGEGRIEVSAMPLDGGRFELRVGDNGCGIAPENLPGIFRYGFSTKGRSGGYGLHSAATLVQSLGGEIEVHSEGLGRGAEFVIRLPLRGGE